MSSGAGPRVVVVGAGIAGCAVAEQLTARGWTDVTLLDQGHLPLTGGSTSHAPGLVFATSPSRTLARLATATVETLSALEHPDGPCFLPVGGLEVATTDERVAELHRRHALGRSFGVRSEVVDAARCAQLHPLLDGEQVLAGLHSPDDGLAKAVRASEVMAGRVAARGGTVRGGVRVTGVTRSNSRVTGVDAMTTDGPEHLAADAVVLCAGFWGAALGRELGVDVPLLPLAHQYVRTTPIASLPSAGAGLEAVLPILRHQDADLYFREHGDVLGIGSYDHDPLPVDVADLPASAMPSSLPFTPEDFAGAWKASQQLLPVLDGSSVGEGFNGVFSFTADGMPLLGPAPGVDGLWVAEALWVTHSVGAAAAVARWMVEGDPGTDLHDADLRRFEASEVSDDAVAARSARRFVEVYDVVHPLAPPGAGRGLRLSPVHERQVALEAVFDVSSGWERAQWYEANAPRVADLPPAWCPPEREGWAARHWSPIVAAEARATREAVGLYDRTTLRRVEVRGPGAVALLERLSSRKVDRAVGTVVYALLLDEAGGVRSDVTIARLGEDELVVGTNTALDEAYLREAAAAGGDDVVITDTTSDAACLGLWGPRARDVLDAVAEEDLSAPGGYYKVRRLRVAGIDVVAAQVSYVGELGWEITVAAAEAVALWDALMTAGAPHGIVAAGAAAMGALRLEKGYRAWGADLTREDDPYQAGLGWAVNLKKPAFVGRDAALALAERPLTRRLAPLVLDDPTHVVLGSEPVLVDTSRGGPGAATEVVGRVTSAGYGHTIGRCVAYAWIPDHLAPGERVSIQWFENLLPATVAAEPLVDPEGSKVRA